MPNEQKPKIKIAYFTFSALVFLGAAILTFIIEPHKKEEVLFSVISMLPFILGTCVAIVAQDRTRNTRNVLLICGVIIVLSSLYLLSFEDVASLIGLYFGGYWVAARYLKQKLQ